MPRFSERAYQQQQGYSQQYQMYQNQPQQYDNTNPFGGTVHNNYYQWIRNLFCELFECVNFTYVLLNKKDS